MMARIKMSLKPHKMKTTREFADAMQAAGMQIPCSDTLEPLRRSFHVYGRRIPNSIAMHPTEGLDAAAGGGPSQMTFHRYRDYAAQGVGILWAEAAAYMPEGRDSLRQLWLHDGNVQSFRRLTAKIDRVSLAAHGYRPYKVLQLTHSGRCAVDASGAPAPLAAFSHPALDAAMGQAVVVTDDYIDNMKMQLAHAARLARDAGFDAVDLKLCHQYLQREFLAAFTRPGKYGGSMDNRFRFTLETIDEIRHATAGGGSIDIAVRLNVYDCLPYPYGWGMVRQPGVMKDDPSEVIELIRRLSARGVKLFDLTTTSPRIGPYGNGYLDNFDDHAEVDPLRGTTCLLNAIRNIRAHIPSDVKVIATGLGWFGPFGAHVGAGGIDRGWFDIAGFSRNILADPGFVPAILREGRVDRTNICVGCDKCFRLFATGLPTGCPTRNPMYKLLYQAAKRNGLTDSTTVY